jgi:hypothetical protein
MNSTIDHIQEEHDQTASGSSDGQGPEGTMYAPRETEASFEEIER